MICLTTDGTTLAHLNEDRMMNDRTSQTLMRRALLRAGALDKTRLSPQSDDTVSPT